MTDAWMTADQCAAKAGVRVATWRAYAARGQAPAPARFDPKTGARQWSTREVEQWMASRPGAGSRSTPRARRRAAERAMESQGD